MAGSATKRRGLVGFVFDVTLENGEEEGAEFAAFCIGVFEELFLNHFDEETLHHVFGLGRRETVSTAPGVERKPIGLAEVFEGAFGLGTFPFGLQHEAPAGGIELPIRGMFFGVIHEGWNLFSGLERESKELRTQREGIGT